MRIHIVRTELEPPEKKSGIGGYADLAQSISEQNGSDVDIIESTLSFKRGVFRFVAHDIIGAFFRIVKIPKNDICHFAYDGSALLIPFCRCRTVTTFHHVVKDYEKNRASWYALWKKSAKKAVKHSDAIISISQQTKDELISTFNADPDKITVIPYMVNNGMYEDPSVEPEKLIGVMGALVPRKNYPALIRTFDMIVKHPGYEEYKLEICGSGPEEENIVKLIDELGLSDKVSIINQLTYEELKDFYNRCKIILNTSMHEGLGLVTVEAQACGTPVLYFKDADIPKEVLAHAIPCADEKDMAEKTIELLENESEYEALSKGGIEFTDALKRFCVEKTLEVYGTLTKGN